MTPTAPEESIATTSPYGNFEHPFNLPWLAATCGAVYVARWTTAHPQQAIKAILKGLRKKGTAWIEMISQCPVHLKTPPAEMFRRLKGATVPLAKEPKTCTRMDVAPWIRKPSEFPEAVVSMATRTMP